MTPKAARDSLFNIRMSSDEMATLAFVAEHYGLSAASLVRFLTKREANAIKNKIAAHNGAKPRKR
jgi:hypothetical protein